MGLLSPGCIFSGQSSEVELIGEFSISFLRHPLLTTALCRFKKRGVGKMGETSWGWCTKRGVLCPSVSCLLLGKVVQVTYSCVHSAARSHLQH